MAVTIALYNQTPKLFAAAQVDLANLRVELLNNSATFTAANTTKTQVDNGSAATVTISIASPGVITDSAHGFVAGQAVRFKTTGALPGGLTAGTWYYVINPTTNTYQVSATVGGAAINTTGTQSGTHTRTSSGSYEFYGNAWPVGGPTLTSVAVAIAALTDAVSNDAKLSAADVSVFASGGSISGYKALLYDATNDTVIAFIDFGQLQSAGDTTEFKIRWSTNGIISWTQ